MKDFIFKCNDCNEVNVKEIEDEFNLTNNINLLKSIYDDSFFSTNCKKCNKNHILEYESLFIDDNYKFIIKLNPSNDIKIILNNDPKYNDYKIRVVNNLNDLKEKLRIFYSTLNDHIIEVIKEKINISYKKEYDIDYLCFSSFKDDKISFVIINSLNEYVGTLNYKIDGYNNLLNKIELNNEIQVVDNALAHKYLSNLK